MVVSHLFRCKESKKDRLPHKFSFFAILASPNILVTKTVNIFLHTFQVVAFHTHFGANSARHQRKGLKLANKPNLNLNNFLITSQYNPDNACGYFRSLLAYNNKNKAKKKSKKKKNQATRRLLTLLLTAILLAPNEA